MVSAECKNSARDGSYNHEQNPGCPNLPQLWMWSPCVQNAESVCPKCFLHANNDFGEEGKHST